MLGNFGGYFRKTEQKRGMALESFGKRSGWFCYQGKMENRWNEKMGFKAGTEEIKGKGFFLNQPVMRRMVSGIF